MDQQHPQVVVAPLADAKQLWLTARRWLRGTNPSHAARSRSRENMLALSTAATKPIVICSLGLSAGVVAIVNKITGCVC